MAKKIKTTKKTKKASKPWSGRFTEATNELVEEFTASIPYDWRLYSYDIAGSIAHATMLAKTGIISQKESRQIISGLKDIHKEIAAGELSLSLELEDIHMNIEDRLIRKVGPVGGKLHTARSRNDQVALDLRMYLRDEIMEISELLKSFQRVIVGLADRHQDVVMPGYTHLQRAQPVLFGHHLLAYYEMFERDRQRLADCFGRVNVMPLGAGALAGTVLPIDRKFVAGLLGFSAVSENSMDAVSDRDFAIEFIAACSQIMVHLSRLSEELVIWSTAEFGFITLSDAFTTGSSIMPQKKNPRRGRAGPRQGRQGVRQSHGAPHDHEGAAAFLQPRHAGGQGAGLRHRGHGHFNACRVHRDAEGHARQPGRHAKGRGGRVHHRHGPGGLSRPQGPSLSPGP